ncbi:hypothetical protein CN495_08590 [Bacillus thuringiensis]|uniref:Group-specific protein n=1 Tax=Bacillus thuringiensis TaxID=1428 RepID=A0ABD6SFT3_BACTU|nr:hypothetical protein [Bacillus thuringiensis]PER55798.1 hypothetical protein CN495_08590 [Bacillus thuringiensis]
MQISFFSRPMVETTLEELELFYKKGKTVKDLAKFLSEVTNMIKIVPAVFVETFAIRYSGALYDVKLTKLDMPKMTRVVVLNLANKESNFLDIHEKDAVNWVQSLKTLMDTTNI